MRKSKKVIEYACLFLDCGFTSLSENETDKHTRHEHIPPYDDSEKWQCLDCKKTYYTIDEANKCCE